MSQDQPFTALYDVGVSVTERKSLRPCGVECLGTGKMEVALMQAETAPWDGDRLKLSTRTSVSCPALCGTAQHFYPLSHHT